MQGVQGGVAQVYIRMWYLEGSGGILPQENFVKLDAIGDRF